MKTLNLNHSAGRQNPKFFRQRRIYLKWKTNSIVSKNSKVKRKK